MNIAQMTGQILVAIGTILLLYVVANEWLFARRSRNRHRL